MARVDRLLAEVDRSAELEIDRHFVEVAHVLAVDRGGDPERSLS
jgi:hypothetical protein